MQPTHLLRLFTDAIFEPHNFKVVESLVCLLDFLSMFMFSNLVQSASPLLEVLYPLELENTTMLPFTSSGLWGGSCGECRKTFELPLEKQCEHLEMGLTMGGPERRWWSWASTIWPLKISTWALAVPQGGKGKSPFSQGFILLGVLPAQMDPCLSTSDVASFP